MDIVAFAFADDDVAPNRLDLAVVLPHNALVVVDIGTIVQQDMDMVVSAVYLQEEVDIASVAMWQALEDNHNRVEPVLLTEDAYMGEREQEVSDIQIAAVGQQHPLSPLHLALYLLHCLFRTSPSLALMSAMNRSFIAVSEGLETFQKLPTLYASRCLFSCKLGTSFQPWA